MVGVNGDGAVNGLDAGADAADSVGVFGGDWGCDADGGHGGRGHGGFDSLADYASAVVHYQEAGDGVRAVVEGWAKGGGHWGHVIWGEGCVVWAE